MKLPYGRFGNQPFEYDSLIRNKSLRSDIFYTQQNNLYEHKLKKKKNQIQL